MNDKGWVKLYRTLTEWEWYTDSHMVHLFVHLVISANHEERSWRGNTIKRGQLVTGLNRLNSATGISIQRLRTCLNKLEKTGEINKQSNNQYTTITICNYDTFQEPEAVINKQSNKRATNEQQATNNKQELKNLRIKGQYKPIEKNTKKEKFSFLHSLIAKGVDEQVAKDWLNVRKLKKASNTETAFNRLAAQIEKTNKEWNEIISICCEHSWKGFNPEWLENKNNKPTTIDAMKHIEDMIQTNRSLHPNNQTGRLSYEQ